MVSAHLMAIIPDSYIGALLQGDLFASAAGIDPVGLCHCASMGKTGEPIAHAIDPAAAGVLPYHWDDRARGADWRLRRPWPIGAYGIGSLTRLRGAGRHVLSHQRFSSC